MTKKILIGASALAVLAGAAAAWAAGGRHFMHGQGLTQRIAKLEDYVQATPQQRQQIDAEVQQIVGIFKAQRQNKGANMHQQLMQLLTSDNLQASDITGLAKQHADQLQAMAAQIAPHVVNIHDTLTSEQRQKLADKLQQMRQNHQEHEGGFGGPGQ